MEKIRSDEGNLNYLSSPFLSLCCRLIWLFNPPLIGGSLCKSVLLRDIVSVLWCGFGGHLLPMVAQKLNDFASTHRVLFCNWRINRNKLNTFLYSFVDRKEEEGLVS